MRRVVSLSIFPSGGRGDKGGPESASAFASKQKSHNPAVHQRSIDFNSNGGRQQQPRLKSCMSVTNLAESLDNDGLAPTSLSQRRQSRGCRPRRIESTPSLAHLASATATFDDAADGSREESNHPEQHPEAAGTGMKRTVSFHRVEVRNFKVCVGDNPSVVRGGPPISLDWSYDPRHQSHDFDEFESDRGDKRRTKGEMRQTRLMREARLRWEGFSDSEMRRAMDEAERTMRKREETVRTLHSMKGEEMMENAARKIKNLVTMNSDKKEQKKLWKKAQKRGQMGSSNEAGVRALSSLVVKDFQQKSVVAGDAKPKFADDEEGKGQLSATASLSDSSEGSSIEEEEDPSPSGAPDLIAGSDRAAPLTEALGEAPVHRATSSSSLTNGLIKSSDSGSGSGNSFARATSASSLTNGLMKSAESGSSSVGSFATAAENAWEEYDSDEGITF